jgi:DNA adenine methylase
MTRTPFRYAGSKNKMLPILMEHLDPLLVKNDSFCDVFVGGGSVLLEVAAKYPKMKLFANDKDKWVSSFWSIVASDDFQKLNELIERLEAPPTIELFYKLRETAPKNDIDNAYRALFFNRTCFSGILSSGPIGGKQQKSKYKVDCRFNFTKLKKKII